jgi:integrase
MPSLHLLPEDFSLKDDAALSRAIDYKNRAIRTSLNAVGEKIGVPFKLGMHVARHTFAVKALNTSGISIHMISRLLGHSSVLVTEKVYAKFLTETLTKEVREKLSFPEYGISY